MFSRPRSSPCFLPSPPCCFAGPLPLTLPILFYCSASPPIAVPFWFCLVLVVCVVSSVFTVIICTFLIVSVSIVEEKRNEPSSLYDVACARFWLLKNVSAFMRCAVVMVCVVSLWGIVCCCVSSCNNCCYHIIEFLVSIFKLCFADVCAESAFISEMFDSNAMSIFYVEGFFLSDSHQDF